MMKSRPTSDGPCTLPLPATQQVLGVVVILVLLTASALGGTLAVGPSRKYHRICEAVRSAWNGDLIEVDGGNTFVNDTCTIEQNNLIIRGLGSPRPLLITDADHAAEGKATFVFTGRNLTIENLEFRGPGGVDQSMNAIRVEGTTFTLRNSKISQTDTGILTNAEDDFNSDILIENSEFTDNCSAIWQSGQYHNVYVNAVRKFVFRYNYSHRCNGGHLVKSRARETWVLYNRLTDETTAADVRCPKGPGGGERCYVGSNYEVDIPDGGHAYVIGNIIQQSTFTTNNNMITFAMEHNRFGFDDLYVINNTLITEVSDMAFVVAGWPRIKLGPGQVRSKPKVYNNLLFVRGETESVDICAAYSAAGWTTHCDAAANVIVRSEKTFVNLRGFDVHPSRLAEDVIDKGVNPGSANGHSLAPEMEYVHPHSARPRPSDGKLDVGAYEFTAPEPTSQR